jgi:peptide-methionine (S)-S-oxide reductase
MKISHTAALALAASLSSNSSAFSINTAGRSFVSRASSSVFQKSHVFPSSLSRSTPRLNSGLNMFFGNLFGAAAAKGPPIDYTALDFPGPELGAAAKEGRFLVTSEREPNLAIATFAGGCFWGLELAYQRVPGVVYTAVGYSQGPEDNPTYNQVCSGATGHTEAVAVYYDPNEVTYEQLLDAFFDRVNPTTVNGQGNDYGKQYRTGVYFHTKEQEEIARARFEQEQRQYKKRIATELLEAKPFWPAEKYHQQYLEKGGRMGNPQSAAKGATDTIRCYG